MTTLHLSTAILITTLALTLSACNRSDGTVGQKVDGAVKQTQEAAANAASQATTSVEKALEKNCRSHQGRFSQGQQRFR
jgi:starvation-inducible outer membrane lipoprotein